MTDDAGWHRTKAEMRLSIVQGLVAALDQWDALSAVVAECPDRSAAVAALAVAPFHFEEMIAQHVLDLRVTLLTENARAEMTAEVEALKEELKRLA